MLSKIDDSQHCLHFSNPPYSHPPEILKHLEGKGFETEDEFYEFIAKKYVFHPVQINFAIDFLKKQRLIKIIKIREKEKYFFYAEITPKGFEIALQNHVSYKSQEINNKVLTIQERNVNVTLIALLGTLTGILLQTFFTVYSLKYDFFWIFLLQIFTEIFLGVIIIIFVILFSIKLKKLLN